METEVAIQTKTAIEVIGGVIGILVGAIAIYKFVYVPHSGVVNAARLADIASIIEDATGNKAVRLVGGENLIRAFIGHWINVCDTDEWR